MYAPTGQIGWVWYLPIRTGARWEKMVELEEVQTLSGGRGFQATSHVKLAIDAADLALNRIGRDHERLCHLCVGLSGSQQTQHSQFLPGERLGPFLLPF